MYTYMYSMYKCMYYTFVLHLGMFVCLYYMYVRINTCIFIVSVSMYYMYARLSIFTVAFLNEIIECSGTDMSFGPKHVFKLLFVLYFWINAFGARLPIEQNVRSFLPDLPYWQFLFLYRVASCCEWCFIEQSLCGLPSLT